VAAGDRIARLSNVSLQTSQSQADREHVDGGEEIVYQASMTYTGLGEALEDKHRLAKRLEAANLQVASLEIHSPHSGVILTPRVEDSIGRYLPEGTVIAEVGDLGDTKARVYVSEYEIQTVRIGSPARLAIDGFAGEVQCPGSEYGRPLPPIPIPSLGIRSSSRDSACTTFIRWNLISRTLTANFSRE